MDQARKLLSGAAHSVLGAQGARELMWHVPKDRTRADAVRVQLLETLASLGRPD